MRVVYWDIPVMTLSSLLESQYFLWPILALVSSVKMLMSYN